MDEEQCFRRHLQRAAQCSVASSNNRFGYLCISSWAFFVGSNFIYICKQKCEAHFETRDRWTANRCWRKLVDCERGLIRLEYVNFDDPKKGTKLRTLWVPGWCWVHEASPWEPMLVASANGLLQRPPGFLVEETKWGLSVENVCMRLWWNTTCSTTASVSSTIIATSVAKLPSMCDSSSGSQSSIKASL